ncbi:MAG: hypothetical protein AseanaTS_08260 [Candidatus Pelagadaptatus aseana]|uniref:FFLEELY motif protein n=1 Tax=Candidatus Pelagadaptatus aseana TaxID=3120508 RepID=UPI0039B1D93A
MIDDIIQNVERFLALRRFKDPAFADKLQQLQQWQHERMSETYWVLLASEAEADLIKFFFDDIYAGLDLEHLGNKLNKTAKLLNKLFTDLEMVHLAIEFNALTGELDEEMTEELFYRMQVDEITPDNYATAFNNIGGEQRRYQQLSLILKFTTEADDIIHDSVVYNAFKLAKYPAKLGGVGPLYDVIARGFKAVRHTPKPLLLTQSILDHERRIYDHILATGQAFFPTYSETAETSATEHRPH